GADAAPAHLPDRCRSLERGRRDSLDRGMRQARRRRNQRLPGDPGAARGSDVRPPLRRHACRPAGPAPTGGRTGGPRMNRAASKQQTAAATEAKAPAAITLIEASTQAMAHETRAGDSELG